MCVNRSARLWARLSSQGKAAALLLLPLLGACGPEAPRHLAGVLRFEAPAGGHVSGSQAYRMTPPAYGDHNALWQTCGVYAQPIYPEYALHSLSHGAVWLTYTGLSAEEIKQLEALAQGQKVLLSPEPEQDAPVIATAWNTRLEAESAADPRLAEFVTQFVDAEVAPEAGRTCQQGYKQVRRGP